MIWLVEVQFLPWLQIPYPYNCHTFSFSVLKTNPFLSVLRVVKWNATAHKQLLTFPGLHWRNAVCLVRKGVHLPTHHSPSMVYRSLSMVLKLRHIYAAAYRIDDRRSVVPGHVTYSFALAKGKMSIGRTIWLSFSYLKPNISQSYTRCRKADI